MHNISQSLLINPENPKKLSISDTEKKFHYFEFSQKILITLRKLHYKIQKSYSIVGFSILYNPLLLKSSKRLFKLVKLMIFLKSFFHNGQNLNFSIRLFTSQKNM